jgi:hypothetical protein
VFDFLAGTGFKEELDEVFAKLEASLKRKDFAAVRNLDRKAFDVSGSVDSAKLVTMRRSSITARHRPRARAATTP